MSEHLTDRDGISLMLEYYGQKFDAQGQNCYWNRMWIAESEPSCKYERIKNYLNKEGGR